MRAHGESINLQFENPLDEVKIQYSAHKTKCLFEVNLLLFKQGQNVEMFYYYYYYY